MASEQTVHAIVLRRRDVGEGDRRLTVLTQEQGVIDVIAKGARRPGSRFSGSSEPLAVGIFHVALGKKNLFITQAQPVTSFPGLRSDYDRLNLALALLEIALVVSPHDQPAENLFQLTIESLRFLEVHPKPLVSFVWSEIKLMQEAGFMPDWETCARCALPVAEAEPAYSPHAGGILHRSCAEKYTDRRFARIEVAYGFAKLAEADKPPTNLKLVVESVVALFPFWRAIAEKPMPALESAVKQVSLNP